jgi:diguanylate cyclase (GGDEF)-like protein/PAS domain S-box-containing protein
VAHQPVLALFLKFFLPLTAMLLGGLVMFGQTEIQSEMTLMESQESLNVGLGAGTLTGHIESISSDLAFLSSHTGLQRAINAPTADNLANLATDFANFSRSKGIYDQLRWLDETGMEIVRVDYINGQPAVIAGDKLQNKGGRYFFTDALKLQPGEVFISPLDLNIEQGKIETPHKPTVRVATPVIDGRGKKRGIVILNYYAREMLQAFATATAGAADHIMVVNGEGYWLKSPKPADEWGFMFKRPELSLAARASAAWQRIRADDRGQMRLADGLWTWQTVYPLVAGQNSSTGAAEAFMPSRGEIETKQYVWKAVAHLSADVLETASRTVWNRLLGMGAILMGLLGFGSWKIAQAWVAQAAAEAEVWRINADLEVTVAKRTQELHQKVVELDGDIAQRKQVEAELRVAATAFEAHVGILVSDAHGTILRVNRTFTQITGYASEEVIGQNPRLLKSGRHPPEFYVAMYESLRHSGIWQGEIWNRRKSGEIYPEWLTIAAVRDDVGQVVNFVATLTDITARKHDEDEIKHLAFYDHLTRLPNRRLMTDRLRHALVVSGRYGRCGALILLDLDNFKLLNDALGHDAGDQLLIEVAKRMESCVREVDTVARLGGDEFVVIVESTDAIHQAATQAKNVSEKILARLSQPFEIEIAETIDGNTVRMKHQHQCTSSIGIALFDGDKITAEELLKRADTAMYEAKAAGRDTLRIFDHGMQAIISARASLESELRRAITDEQFQVYFQPQVDASGRVIGAEALVRWQHPRRGMVSPAEFIPVAEDTGLILPIGFWVLHQSCHRLAEWAKVAEFAHLSLAVNISARQFSMPHLVDEVLSLVEATGAPADHLKLELTESLLLKNAEDVIAKINELRHHGVRFSLDDFGTGYSSLSYLKALPLDQLKIDQSFVRDVLTDNNDAAIARTIVALANALGISVIAEGVETEEQRVFLGTVGCPHYQGYLFSRPVPGADFEAYVRRQIS